MNAKRDPGEDFASYRRRLKWSEEALRARLKQSVPAAGYTPGPHRTHQPKTLQAMVKVGGAVVPMQVTHPGTLRKVKS